MIGRAANHGEGPVRRRSGLTWAEVWMVHVSTALVGGTGLAYATFRYLVDPPDPWAVVNHPWQPAAQHLHIVVAPLLVFAAGLLWRPHVMTLWSRGNGSRRRTGIATAVSVVPMVVSGYLTQVAVERWWREAWGGVHTAVSLLWLAGYAAHLLSRRAGGQNGA